MIDATESTRDAPLAANRIAIRRLYAWLALAVVVLLVYGSFVPFRYVHLDLPEAIEEFKRMFQQSGNVGGTRVDWSVNFLVTLPFGFFASGAWMADRPLMSRMVWVLPLVLLSATLLSVGVEFGQVWFGGRVPSLADIKAQSLGTITGIGLWVATGPRLTRWLNSFLIRRGQRERIEWLLQAYVLGLFVYSVLPLDVITSPGELAQKLRGGKFELIPFTYKYDSIWRAVYAYFTQVALFIPVGLWASMALRHPGRPVRPLAQRFLLGLTVVIGIETAQLLIVSRYTSTTDILLGACGVAVGCFVLSGWHRRPAENRPSVSDADWGAGVWILGAIGYSFILAFVFWAPYDFTTETAIIRQRWDAFWSVPFARMQTGSDLAAMFSLIRMVAWFIPLGLLVGLGVTRIAASITGRRLLYLAGLLSILVVATGIELGQILLPSKFADLTDVILCAAGGALGFCIASKIPLGSDVRRL